MRTAETIEPSLPLLVGPIAGILLILLMMALSITKPRSTFGAVSRET